MFESDKKNVLMIYYKLPECFRYVQHQEPAVGVVDLMHLGDSRLRARQHRLLHCRLTGRHVDIGGRRCRKFYLISSAKV